MLQAGVDEVGYGGAFGDLTLALVVIDVSKIKDLGIKDSKKLTATKREYLSNIIKEMAEFYSIVSSTNEEINNKGVLVCWKECVKQLHSQLKDKFPKLDLYIDGTEHIKLSNTIYLHKGDDLIPAISCASIIAKVHRDNKVIEQQEELDIDYDIKSNKGYLTVNHIKALKEYGSSKYHRTKYIRNHL